MTDTRTTHDRHPAARFEARPRRALVGPLKDAAGRAHIDCATCDASSAWNDAVQAGWITAPSYAYTCPTCQAQAQKE